MLKGFKKRRLAVALSACMLMPSAAVHALGMGEIEVLSALNEPLNAEIKLLSATTEELDALEVSLASKDAFDRMGIERMPLLTQLSFEVVREGAKAPHVRVVSSQPIREPFLDFILKVDWVNGQMLREYTLLLDPPVFEEAEPVSTVAAATTQSSQIQRADQAPAPAPTGTPQPWVAPAGSYGPTTRADTLWTVARDMRPSGDVTVPQMMLALQKENPEAFYNGNINNLKAGYILRAPQMEVITSISKSQAANEANRQYQDWLASTGKGPAVGSRQQVASTADRPASATPSAAAPAPTAAPTPSGARLKLLSPDEAGVVGGAGTGIGAGAPMEQLAIALETAEATKQENAELKERLADLERQLQAVQRLLTLKGDTLGALQSASIEAQQADAPAPEAAPAPAAEAPAAAAEPQAAAPAAKPEPVKPKPVIAPEPVQPSLIDELLANQQLLMAGGGAVVLLILIVALIRRRREQSEAEAFESYSPAPVAAGAAAGAVAAGAATAAADEMPEAPDTDTAKVADEMEAAGFSEVETASTLGDFADGNMGAIHAEESEIDPIAEADVYLAYRRYEQAEALLKDAIRSDEDRQELKLKLLEIYFTTKDQDAFEAQAEGLYAALGGQQEDLWNQAVEMGREISPDHPLFAEGGGLLSDEPLLGGSSDELMDLDSSIGEAELDTDLSDSDLADSLDMPGDDQISAESDLSESVAAESADELDDFVADLDVDGEISLDDIGLSEEDFEGGLDDLSDIGGFSLDGSSTGADDLGDDLLDLGGELDEFDTSDELASLNEATDSVTEASDQIDELTAEASESLDALGEELDLDADTASLESMGEDLSELDSALDDLEGADFSADSLQDELADGLDMAADDLNDLDLGDSESLEDLATDLSDELDVQDSSLADLGDSVAQEAEEAVAGLDDGLGDLGDLSDELADSELSLDDAVDNLDDLSAELDELTEGLSDLDIDLPDAGKSEAAKGSDDVADKWSLAPAVSSFESRDLKSTDSDNGFAPVSNVHKSATEGHSLDHLSLDNEADISSDLDSAFDEAMIAEPELGDDLDEADIFDSSDDIVGTKLDLARAYIDMGDQDGARTILDEVVKEGDDSHRSEAEQLMRQIS